MNIGLPIPVRDLDETFSTLNLPVEESFRLEDLIEQEEESVSVLSSADARVSQLLRDLDAIHNQVQNFYSDLRGKNLPFFGFNELHDSSKKFDNTLHRAVDLLKRTRTSLKKHME